jgi:hypothetical protein
MSDQICRTKGLSSFYCRECTPPYTMSPGLVCVPCGEEICCIRCFDKLTTLKTGNENDKREFILCPQCLRAHLKKPVYDFPIQSKLLAFKRENKLQSSAPPKEPGISKQQLYSLMRSMTREFELEINECCERIKSEVALAVDEKVNRLFKMKNDLSKVISNYQTEAKSFMRAYTRLNDLNEENFAECLRAMTNEQCENIEFIREIMSKLNDEMANGDLGGVASDLLRQLGERLRSKADIDFRLEARQRGGSSSSSNSSRDDSLLLSHKSNQKIHIKIKMVLDYDLSKLSLNENELLSATNTDLPQIKN